MLKNTITTMQFSRYTPENRLFEQLGHKGLTPFKTLKNFYEKSGKIHISTFL